MSERNQSFDVSRRGALRWLGSAAMLLAILGLPGIGRAQARLLDGPRAAGIVGERFDGYAVARGSVSPDVAALIDKVNKERHDVYASRAASENVPIEAIGKIYAAEIIKSAPAGTWFLSESGQWTQK
jgi:uncharacterized protein YdbL (DUF1318 family)